MKIANRPVRMRPVQSDVRESIVNFPVIGVNVFASRTWRQRPIRHSNEFGWSGRLPEVSKLCIERTLERRPARAPLDVVGKTPVARHDVGVVQDAQNCRHHQIAGREPIAIEIGFVTKGLGKSSQPLLHELHGAWTTQLGPLLVSVEQVNQGDVYDVRLDRVERLP